MKNLTKTTLAACFVAVLLLWNGCKKDKDEPVSDNNNPPVLNVGADVTGMTDATSNLSVTASDPDGDALQITWNIIQSPVGSAAVITSTGMFTATFITSIPGLYKVEVVADDGKGKNATGILTLYIGGVLPNNISSNITYPNLFDNEDYPDYYALVSAQITAGVTLEPGVVIELGSDVRLWFTGNSAYLNAEGTSTKNITFRGVDKVNGSWKTLHIASNNVNNKLNYVKIHHAGSSETSNQKTALYLQSNTSAQLSIRNTTITQSGGYALYVDGDHGNISEFSNNNFNDNEAAPMRIGAPNLFALDKNSVFLNNGIQAIEVAAPGNTANVFENSGTVPALSVPYHSLSSFTIESKVTFEPGVTCLFDQSLRILVTQSGTLIADGTESQKIKFSGINQAPGSWKGIELTSSSENIINYGIVEYGGSTTGRSANIYLYGSPGAKLTITNSNISDSQTWGIWVAPGNAILNESNNTFSNNALGDIKP
ncbi:MAG TPA: Ig-like domain-containing protein [Bacteroidales bacterium]